MTKAAARVAFAAILLIALAGRGHAAPAAKGGHVPRVTKFVVVPGESLWVEILGDAPGIPLFVANGGPGFSHDYELIGGTFERMARTRRIVFWDQRGTGRSGPLRAGQSCTAWDQVEDLDHLRAALGIDRIDLFGHSWGGLLAMMYATRHADHLAHLVLCDSASPKIEETPFRFGDFDPDGGPPAPGVAYGDTTQRRPPGEAYLAKIFVHPDLREAFITRMRELPKLANDVNAAVFASLDSVDVGPDLAKLTTPTLVVTGRWDVNVAPLGAWRIHKAIPGSRWHVFEESGHVPAYEEPDEFIAVIAGFLGR